MIKYENHCCDCAVSGYPCMESSCPNVDVPVYYCDNCSNDTHAKYDIDGEHLCEEHTKEYFKEVFEDLTISEQAEVLDISLKSLED